MHSALSFLVLLLAAVPTSASAQASAKCDGRARCVIVDDFQQYAVNGRPSRWSTNQDRGEIVPVDQAVEREDERFVIQQDGNNRYVRAIVRDQAHRLILEVGDGFSWSIEDMPMLSWRWRALTLPEGAQEDHRNQNDTGAAVYVVFDKDWLGRPRSIKYTYSSTLPPGTVVSYGPLKVVVLASGATDGTGSWLAHERNVEADFRWLFGRRPPSSPTALVIWSDSDTTDSLAEADFDDIRIASKE